MVPGTVTVTPPVRLCGRFRAQSLLKFSVDSVVSFTSANNGRSINAKTPASPSVIGAAETAVKELWSTSRGSVPIGDAISAAIAPDGSVWVVDAGMQTIHIFGPDGVWTEDWSIADGKPFSFRDESSAGSSYPYQGQVAFFADGSFLVADSGNGRLLKFDADRNLIATVNGATGSDETFAALGRIYPMTDGSFAVAEVSATRCVSSCSARTEHSSTG